MQIFKSLFVVVFLFLTFSNQTVIPHIGKIHGENIPIVRLQLDLEPEQRWVNIAKQFIVPLHTTIGLIQYILDSIPGSGLFLEVFSYWVQNYYQYDEMVKEVKGVCEGAMLPFPQTMFLNFMYEFTTIKACSGVLVRNDQNQILHGRNMDFFLWNRFSSLLAEVQIYDKNTYKCTIMSVVGSVFSLTGTKPYHFGLNEDTRKSKNDKQTFNQIVYNLVVNQYVPSAWLLRKVLEEEQTWQSARQRLIDTNVSAPIYYIISGLSGNEGSVIEKSSVGVHNVYDLNETTWYLVQSNYDRDQPDPWEDPRRVPVEKKIQKIGQNMTIQDLFDKIMTSWPTFNIATILTMTTVPKTGYVNSTAWYGITNIANSSNTNN